MIERKFHPLIPANRTVNDLLPGAVIVNGDRSATFIARCWHPLYMGFMLVIWRLDDGTVSLDALTPEQEVGQQVAASEDERVEALRAALSGSRDVPR